MVLSEVGVIETVPAENSRLFGKLNVQVPLVVIVHVPVTVTWRVVPAMVTEETPPPPPVVHVFGDVHV